MAKKKFKRNNDDNWRKVNNPDFTRVASTNRLSRSKKVKLRSAWIGRAIIGAIALSILSFFTLTYLIKEKSFSPQDYLSFVRDATEYSDSNFKLKYPKNWQVNRYSPNEFSQIVAEFVPPNSYNTEEIKPKIFIEIRELKKPLSLTEIRQAAASEINAFLPNSDIFEKKEIELDSQPAYLLVYTGLEGKNKLQKMQIGTIKGNNLYVLTYEAKRDRYPEYQPTIQAMIDSFEFIEKPELHSKI